MTHRNPYALALERTLSGLKQPLDVIIVIDGSSSVSAANWELEKMCAKLIAMRLPFGDSVSPKTRVAFLQFTDEVTVGCPFTPQLEIFSQALPACVQRGGRTSARVALESALSMFMLDNRNAAKCIILLTDGDVNDARNVPAIAGGIAAAKVVLVVCGIGLAQEAEKSVLALQPDCAAFFNNFAELQACMMELALKPADPPKLSIRTTGTTRMAFDVLHAHPFVEAELQVREADGNRWATAGTSATPVVKAEKLKHGTPHRFRVRVRLPNNGPWTSFSDEVAFITHQLRPESAILRTKDARSAKLTEIRKSLAGLSLDGIFADADITALNVLLMGRMANGKSSYLNTIDAAIHAKWRGRALAGEKSGGGTFTLKISKEPIVESLKVWDTFGWDGHNWPDSDVGLLLAGRLKEGYEFGKDMAKSITDRPQLADKVHAVIIVCDLVSATSEQQMRELGKFYQLLTSHQLQPIIVLTKPDTVTNSTDTPEERLTPETIDSIYDNGLLEMAVSTFCKLTKISRNYAFPVLNYTGLVEPTNGAQDLLALFPLSAAVDQAKQFVKSDLQRSVRLIDWDTKQRIGAGDILLKDGELDSPVSLLREVTVHHVKFVDVAGLSGYQFLTKARRVVALDEERDLIKIHQCRVKDSEERYVVYLTRTSPRSVATPPTSAQMPSPSITMPQQSTPSTPISATPTCTALIKVSLRWKSLENKIAGVEIAADANAAHLRQMIVDEGVEEELGKESYVFAQKAPNPPLPRANEATTPLTSLFLSDTERAILLVPPPPTAAPVRSKISVILCKSPTERESIGFIEDVDLSTTLDVVRRDKLTPDEVEDLPKEYRFLDAEGDPIVPAKEKLTKLDKCVRKYDKGNLSFWIKSK